MKISFKTLGCRLNQHETDALVSGFDQSGYTIVPFKEKADITVINTCTVTSQSDHKSRNIIQQAIKANPDSKIVVTGCMAQQYKTELEQIQGVSMVITNSQKSNIIDLINAKLGISAVAPKDNYFNYQPLKKSLHTRAAIKIQDGCDNFCTFCIIPMVRGRGISRPVDDILANILKTVANGFKEIVVTGVNIGRYYYQGVRFVALIKKILDLPGDFRVRISSLEPDGFGDDLIALFHHPKLTPHLHLCLQSGSEQILLKMRRMYSVSNFVALTQKIKSQFPDFNLTTDIIVGFPGETDYFFKQTMQQVKNIGFSHVHTFKYSKRAGTYAERMSNQVDEKTKNTRSKKLRHLSDKNKQAYYQQFIGKNTKVLVEKHLASQWYIGYSENYIPVKFKHHENMINEFIYVKLTNLCFDEKIMLEGEIKSGAKYQPHNTTIRQFQMT